MNWVIMSQRLRRAQERKRSKEASGICGEGTSDCEEIICDVKLFVISYDKFFVKLKCK